MVEITALVAGDTPGKGFIPNPENIRVNSILIQRLRHRTKRRICAAFPVRATVYQQYLQKISATGTHSNGINPEAYQLAHAVDSYILLRM